MIPSTDRCLRMLSAVLVTVSVAAHGRSPIGTNTTGVSFDNPSNANQAVEFEAVTVGFYPSGTVTFMDANTVLCNAAPVATYTNTGIAYCTASFSEGPHLITARYAGDLANAPSSGCLVQLVGGDAIWMDGFECVRP